VLHFLAFVLVPGLALALLFSSLLFLFFDRSPVFFSLRYELT